MPGTLLFTNREAATEEVTEIRTSAPGRRPPAPRQTQAKQGPGSLPLPPGIPGTGPFPWCPIPQTSKLLGSSSGALLIQG